MATFRTEILIDAAPDLCFDAARDMGLHVASAARSNEHVVAGRSEGLLELGESVTFEGRHFGLRFRMTSKLVEFDRPHRFVDEMQSGPFKRLRHEHIFRPEEGGTRMADVLDFSSPMGVIGRLADKWFIEPHLRRFVNSRAQALKKYLERS